MNYNVEITNDRIFSSTQSVRSYILNCFTLIRKEYLIAMLLHRYYRRFYMYVSGTVPYEDLREDEGGDKVVYIMQKYLVDPSNAKHKYSPVI